MLVPPHEVFIMETGGLSPLSGRERPEVAIEIARDSIWVIREGLDISATQRSALGRVATMLEDPMTRRLPNDFKWWSSAFYLSGILARSEGHPSYENPGEVYDYSRSLEKAVRDASVLDVAVHGPEDLQRLEVVGDCLTELLEKPL